MEKWLSAKKMKGYSLGTHKGKQFKPSKDLVSLYSPAEDDLLSRVATYWFGLFFLVSALHL
jgi:hypothetical protein